MSSTPTDSNAVPVVDVAADAPVKVRKFTLNRALKKIDAVENKNTKLVEDNKKLKAALHEIRSAHSRIRRIPKAAVPVATE
jgi:hypothetical protein